MKFAICMYYDEKIKQYADKCKYINQAWCNKNGYDFIFTNEKLINSSHPSYNKLPFLLNTLIEKDYDYLVWVDADAWFIKDYKLDMFVSSGKDFIFSGDITDNINCGIFFVKNTQYTRDFLCEWINGKYKNINPAWWEQGKLTTMFNQNVLDIKNHCFIYRMGMLQNFKSPYETSLIYHMAGQPDSQRVLNVERFLKNISID